MRIVGEEQPQDGPPPLTDGVVTLRRPRAGDAEQRFALGQDPQIMRMFGADPTAAPPWTRERATQWVMQVMHDELGWIVEVDGRLLGSCRLHTVNVSDGNAMLAIGLIDPARLSQGFGRRVIKLILDHAFHEMKLHRVALRTIEFNTRAIRCYERCGFRREGVLREAARIGNTWYDDVLMAKLARDH
ncbi:GNAT family N-acetyltransferase [Tropicibacter naphthalenivorans]|uniref:Spermidine N1-acetyltransferase n=1 Tax=Tropicibacter naphthalenivorans TaxID=441103 RepID=A0A0P1GGQ2_9RHOB|nr:GNAT family protein [Tropicibacter naphthalenivorans]CUH74863.1 spermidine N1-acetyltransferase [Tropicibacter naphthalenivorans]SMC48624.1 Protein N-acetyltransferase, RimJ/RimL family [Tropicibacter naphthalenivorans]